MYEGIIQDLIDELGRLPGVGPKSAQRIAFHIIASDRMDVTRLAEVLKTVKERVKFCTTCGNISEEDLCRICRDPRRETLTPNGFINLVKLVAVASPSRFGSVAIIISLISVAANLLISSLIRRFSGPMPSIGEIAPPNT